MKLYEIAKDIKQLKKLDVDDEAYKDTIESLQVMQRETAMQVFTDVSAIDPYLAHIRSEIDLFVPDVTTKKGRDAIASMAYKVSQSKSALEALGKALADEAKEIPKKIDATRKHMKDTLDSWRDEVRKPLDDWETEQKRLEEIRLAEEAAKALAIKIENDHEIALLLNEKFDRDAEESRKVAEQARIDYEARIAKDAADRATREAEERAAQAKRDADLEIEKANREKAEAEAAKLRAEQKAADDLRIASESAEKARLKAIDDARLALEQAEKEKQLAIENERRRVAAEEERLRKETEARENNAKHCKAINNQVLDDLVILGLDSEMAKKVIIAIAQKKVRNIQINY